MKKMFLFSILTVFLFSCGQAPVPTSEVTAPPGKNIFLDPQLQEVYTLGNQRDSQGLLPFLEDKNPLYRRTAAIALASIQDPTTVPVLAKLLKDPEPGVRGAAAYALGQGRDESAQPLLIDAYKSESSPEVNLFILEAVGKCGNAGGLKSLVQLDFPKRNPMLLAGQAWGIYRFGLRGIVSNSGTRRAIDLLSPNFPEKVRFIAANYLARGRDIDLYDYPGQLLHAYRTSDNTFIRMNLLTAMGKTVKKKDKADGEEKKIENAKERKIERPEILFHIKKVLGQEDIDYRLKVNALRALRDFQYPVVRELLFPSLEDKQVNVSVAAAELLLAIGNAEDAPHYLEWANRASNWRSRATLMKAALTFAPGDDSIPGNKELRERISAALIDAYKKSAHNYEKAWLLDALAADPDKFDFIKKEAFANLGTVIGTNGMNGLTEMCRKVNKAAGTNQKTNLEDNSKDELKIKELFAKLFKDAALTGDPAFAGLAATILREPEMNFKPLVKSTIFLETALKQCQLPRDIETYRELQKTLAYFNPTLNPDSTPPAQLPTKNKPIDWKLVTSIAPGAKVKISTTRGNIFIRLLVNESPGSAANFVQLIKEGFYRDNFIHRVVPNFVVQDGCPRGDGWGSPMAAIGSELGPLYYDEGSVGMASSGKDTEGSQWFITHSPTPHLDGRYTIFGRVTAGMETVHRLDVGDKILGYELL